MTSRQTSFPFPRIVHQIWVQGADRAPERYRQYGETWKARHPDWSYRLWDDRSIRELLARRRPELLALYTETEIPRARADIGRYVILEAEGGLYADLDTVCLRPMDPVLDSAGAPLMVQYYCPWPWHRRKDGAPYACVVNSIIACAAEHHIWPGLIAELARHHRLGPWWWLQTGPELFRRHAARVAQTDRVEVLPARSVWGSFLAPRRWMWRVGRRDPRVRVLDFNDDGRRALRRLVSPGHVYGRLRRRFR